MMSIAPIITDLTSKLLGGILGQRGSGSRARASKGGVDFALPGNSSMVGLPNHLPPYMYFAPNDRGQKGGLYLPLTTGQRSRKKQPKRKRGIGAMGAMAAMTLAPIVLKMLQGGGGGAVRKRRRRPRR